MNRIRDGEPRLRGGPVRDARGRPVRPLDPRKLYLLGRRDVIEPAVLEQIVEALEPGARRRRLVALVMLPAIAVLAVGGVLVSAALEGPAAWQDLLSTVTNPVIISSCATCFAVSWLTGWRTSGRRNAAVMLDHRCCPGCGYGLKGLSVDPTDGATICPECASAWRLDVPERVGRTLGATSARSPIVLTVLLALGVAAFVGGLVVYLVRGGGL
jgi:hypothetical protein